MDAREATPSWDPRTLRGRLRASGYDTSAPLPPVAWFGDDPEMARQLAELVRRNRKTATAGLLWKWRRDGKEPPGVGDRQVIIDWSGMPQAVIEMTDVRVVPFEDVTAEFAREEGEGDLSLAYWRDVHWSFFARECERIGRTPTPAMLVICMRFRLVHAVEPPGAVSS